MSYHYTLDELQAKAVGLTVFPRIDLAHFVNTYFFIALLHYGNNKDIDFVTLSGNFDIHNVRHSVFTRIIVDV